jgi:hypothetical protein
LTLVLLALTLFALFLIVIVIFILIVGAVGIPIVDVLVVVLILIILILIVIIMIFLLSFFLTVTLSLGLLFFLLFFLLPNLIGLDLGQTGKHTVEVLAVDAETRKPQLVVEIANVYVTVAVLKDKGHEVLQVVMHVQLQERLFCQKTSIEDEGV